MERNINYFEEFIAIHKVDGILVVNVGSSAFGNSRKFSENFLDLFFFFFFLVFFVFPWFPSLILLWLIKSQIIFLNLLGGFTFKYPYIKIG